MKAKPTVKARVMKCLGHYRSWIIMAIFLGLLGGEIYAFRHALFTTLMWSGLWSILVVMLEFALVWFKRGTVKKLIGEDKPEPREQNVRSRTEYFFSYFLFLLLLPPFTIYFLVGDMYKTIPAVAQFSIVAVAPTLGGLVLTAASALEKSDKRLQLIRVSQKFIVATVLFIIFVPSLLIVDLLHGINITSFTFSNLHDPVAWARGIYFWLAVPCFYGGTALFLWGLRDLVYVLMGLASASEQPPGQ